MELVILSIFPVKQTVWVNIGNFADAEKYKTNLKVRSKDLFGLHIRFLMWRLIIPLILVCFKLVTTFDSKVCKSISKSRLCYAVVLRKSNLKC